MASRAGIGVVFKNPTGDAKVKNTSCVGFDLAADSIAQACLKNVRILSIN